MRNLKGTIVALLLAAILAACTDGPEAAHNAVADESAVQQKTAIATPTSTVSSTDTPEPTHTPSPSHTPEPTETQTPIPTATMTPTATATATLTPTSTSTPVGGHLRAYNDHYIYLDDGHEEPKVIAFPSMRLSVPGYAYFPAWSPDQEWLSSLQSTKFTHGSSNNRISVRNAKLTITKADSDEYIELAELNYPDISHAIPEGDGWTSITGDYMLQGNFVAWSPDSSKIAYLNYLEHSSETGRPLKFEILVVPVTGGDAVKIGETTLAWNDTSFDMRPFAWSPDSSQIAYTSYGDEDFGLHIVKADGTESSRIFASRYLSLPFWSDDGNSIFFQRAGRLPSAQILIKGDWQPSFYPIGGEILQVDVNGSNLKSIAEYVKTPVLSPNGEMIAYSDGSQITVLSIGDRTKQAITYVCGLDDNQLRWSPDSQAIAFESENVIYENGRFNGCSFGDGTNTEVYSVSGEQIASVRYKAVQGYQDWYSNRPRYAFSPDSDWFAITYRHGSKRDIRILLVNMRDGTETITNIEAPYAGYIAWAPKY